MAGSRPLASRPPDGVSALYSMACQRPLLVEQAIEPTVQRARTARMGRLLASQLDRGPRPGQRGPPVGIGENAIDGQVEQRGEVEREAAQASSFGRTQSSPWRATDSGAHRPRRRDSGRASRRWRRIARRRRSRHRFATAAACSRHAADALNAAGAQRRQVRAARTGRMWRLSARGSRRGAMDDGAALTIEDEDGAWVVGGALEAGAPCNRVAEQVLDG